MISLIHRKLREGVRVFAELDSGGIVEIAAARPDPDNFFNPIQIRTKTAPGFEWAREVFIYRKAERV